MIKSQAILRVSFLLTVPAVAVASSIPADGYYDYTDGCKQLQKKTCDGDCINSFYFDNWIGDGICDYGGYGVSPSSQLGGINFDCDEFEFDGGDCPNGGNPIFVYNLDIPQPMAAFELNQDKGLIKSTNGEYLGSLKNGTSWAFDPDIGRFALNCTEKDRNYATLDDIGYGDAGNGNFTIMFWFNNPDSDGSFFEYLFSHGSGPSSLDSVFEPNNIHIYIPDQNHPTVEGFVRTVALGTDSDNDDQYYVDTDGKISFNGERDISGHVDVYDGKWHFYALTRIAGENIRVYIDGRIAGIADAKGGSQIDPYGEIYLCGRGDKDQDRFFGGMLMKLYIYKEAFNETEIIAKYQIDYDEIFKPSPPPPPAKKECDSIPALSDCAGNCFNQIYKAWIGDGICDNGYFGHTFNFQGNDFVPLNLNCNLTAISAVNDGGDCDKPLKLEKSYDNPMIYFPFDNDPSTVSNNAIDNLGDISVKANLEEVDLVMDEDWGRYVVECRKNEQDVIEIDNFDYPELGFTINTWFKTSGLNGGLYEYIYSHGNGTGDLFFPDNVHFYLPEVSRNLSSFVRTILKGTADNSQDYYLDSDGVVTTNSYRDIPNHVDVGDGTWHMYSLVANPVNEYGNSGGGFSIYIDGRYTGHADAFGGAGDAKIKPPKNLFLCGRTDENSFRHFNGRLAEFSIFPNPFDHLQILSLYFSKVNKGNVSDCILSDWGDCPLNCIPPGATSPGKQNRFALIDTTSLAGQKGCKKDGKNVKLTRDCIGNFPPCSNPPHSPVSSPPPHLSPKSPSPSPKSPSPSPKSPSPSTKSPSPSPKSPSSSPRPPSFSPSPPPSSSATSSPPPPAVATSPSPPSSQTNNGNTSPPKKGKSSNTGAIVGGIFGALAGIALLGALGYIYVQKNGFGFGNSNKKGYGRLNGTELNDMDGLDDIGYLPPEPISDLEKDSAVPSKENGSEE